MRHGHRGGPPSVICAEGPGAIGDQKLQGKKRP